MATHSSILAWRIPWTEDPRWATAHRVAKSQTQLKQLSTHACRPASVLRSWAWEDSLCCASQGCMHGVCVGGQCGVSRAVIVPSGKDEIGNEKEARPVPV